MRILIGIVMLCAALGLLINAEQRYQAAKAPGITCPENTTLVASGRGTIPDWQSLEGDGKVVNIWINCRPEK